MKPIHPSLSLPAPLFLGFQSRTAHLLSFFFTATYVGSIYLSQTLFSNSSTHSSNPSDPSSHLRSPNPYLTANQADARRYELDGYDDDLPRRGSRDHPDTIRMRMKAVGVATLGSVLGVWWVVGVTGEYNPIQAVGRATQVTPYHRIISPRIVVSFHHPLILPTHSSLMEGDQCIDTESRSLVPPYISLVYPRTSRFPSHTSSHTFSPQHSFSVPCMPNTSIEISHYSVLPHYPFRSDSACLIPFRTFHLSTPGIISWYVTFLPPASPSRLSQHSISNHPMGTNVRCCVWCMVNRAQSLKKSYSVQLSSLYRY